MHTSNSFLFHFFIEKLSKSLTILRVHKHSTRSEKEYLVHPHKPGQCIYIFFKVRWFFFFFEVFHFFFTCVAAAQLTWYICIVRLWYFQLFLLLTKKWTMLSSFKLQLFAMLLFVYHLIKIFIWHSLYILPDRQIDMILIILKGVYLFFLNNMYKISNIRHRKLS